MTQYGITWTFDKPAHVGQFVNTDYYVVGPVTVKSIDPKPLYGEEIPEGELGSQDKKYKEEQRVRNGFMLNPPAAAENRLRQRDQELLRSRAAPEVAGHDEARRFARVHHQHTRGCQDQRPTARTLTGVAFDWPRSLRALGEPQPADAFRPAFCDREARVYLARNLKRELLPTVPATESVPKIEQYVGFTQKPWVATCFFAFEQPVENMPMYGREYGRVVGNAALLLCTDFKPAEKEPLLVNFVQVGIDLGGMVRAGPSGLGGFRRARQRAQAAHRLRGPASGRRATGQHQ